MEKKYRITGLPKAQNGVQKWTGTGDGFYTFQGTDFIKKGDKWFKEINGEYVPLAKDVARRSAVLDKQARKLAPYEIQERLRRYAGISRYDALETFKPQVASTTNVTSTVKPLPAIEELDKAKQQREEAKQQQQLFDAKFSVDNGFTDYGVAEAADKHNAALNFHEGWMNSPMYKEMLKNSSPQEWEELNKFRLQNFYQLKNSDQMGYGLYGQPEYLPDATGLSYSDTGQIEYFPLSEGIPDVSAHEVSHSIDRPRGKYPERLIPLSDLDYIESSKPKSFFDSPRYKSSNEGLKMFYKENPEDYENFMNYVAEPTETRARLNAIRAISKESGIYDPYTEKVTPEIYNLLKTKEFNSLDEGFDPLKQLQDVYTDEQIMHMLNTISKNDNQNSNLDGINNLTQAQTGLQLLNAGKTAANLINRNTIGAVNELAKYIPTMINPIHIPTFGMGLGERSMIGPFTGSPLNFLPFYGKDLAKEMGPNEAFRYFGDTLDYAKLNNNMLDSAQGPWRPSRSTIAQDKGQWFEQGTPNASYTNVFGLRANPDAPGSNLRYMPKGNRNGVLIGDVSNSNPRVINLNDPGATLYRRLPLSNRLSPVDLDNPWDWKNYGGNFQALAERYGYATAYAAMLAGMGLTGAQETLDEYVNDPVKESFSTIADRVSDTYNSLFKESEDYRPAPAPSTIQEKKKGGQKDIILDLTDAEIEEYKKGGYVVEYLDEIPKAQRGLFKKKQQPQYLPGAWANTAPDLIEPGQEQFPLPESSVIEPWITKERIATQSAANDIKDFIADYYRQNQELDKDIFNEKLKDREAFHRNLKNANARVQPIERISIVDYNKMLKQNPSLEKEQKSNGIYANVNKDKGFVELFPINEIYQDALRYAVKEGNSIDATLKYLEKRGYGNTAAIKKQLGTDVIKQLETGAKQYAATNPPVYTKGTYMVEKDYGQIDTSANLKNKWKDNDIITLARDAKFIDAFDINNFDSSSPNARNDSKWNAQILNKLRSGEWGWKPKTNELVRLKGDEAYEPLAISRKSTTGIENTIKNLTGEDSKANLSKYFMDDFWDYQEAQQRRAKDYGTLGQEGFQRKYSPTPEQLQERWREGKTAVNIDESEKWRPQKKIVDGQFQQYGIEVPAGVDPVTGETITQYVSPNDYAGQTVYMSPKESQNYEKSMLADNTEAFYRHPLFYAPGMVAAGAVLAPTSIGGAGWGSSILNAAPISALPGLNLGNAANAYFAYETLKDNGLAEQAYDAFQRGDVGEGLGDAFWSGLSLAPYAKGLKGTYDLYRGLTAPGKFAGRVSTGLPFSASWTSADKTKGLAIQNPNWSWQSKELLPGLTSKFNRTLGPSLGEIKLYGTQANPAAASQNLLGTGNTLKSLTGKSYLELPPGKTYHNFDDFMGPEVNVPIRYSAESYTPLRPEGQPWQGGNWTYDYNPNDPASFKEAGLDFNYYNSQLPLGQSDLFNVGDFNFKQFSPGWQATQELGNLASYGKQPLLRRADFVMGNDLVIDRLLAKGLGKIDEVIRDAELEGLTADDVLNRVSQRMSHKFDPKLKSERPKGSIPFYIPENWSTSNRAAMWNPNFGNYRPFARDLNEYGPQGGKLPISFGDSGELDNFYFNEIKRYEDMLSGDYNLSPEVEASLQERLSNIYKKGISSGVQQHGINMNNPWNYKSDIFNLSPNKYGGSK